MHARFRPIVVFERLLPGSRMRCRDAGTPSAARRSVVNAAGISTTRRQLSADHHLSRATKQHDDPHSITGEGLCRSAIAAEMLGLRVQRCRTPIARFAKLSRSAITVMM